MEILSFLAQFQVIASSVIYRGAMLWNKLVPSTKELPFSQFRSELRVGLLGKCTFETNRD